ncbi:hypothetical protein [Halovulum sp. GXIMD14793]
MRPAKHLGATKDFLLFDLFESLSPQFKEAIMCDDEIKRRLAKEGEFQFVEGDMNKRIAEFGEEKFCFIHYDLGYHPNVLRFLLHKLVDGRVVVFDNYGFATASPALYQTFFKGYDQAVMSVPFSEQGVLIKRPMSAAANERLASEVAGYAKTVSAAS